MVLLKEQMTAQAIGLKSKQTCLIGAPLHSCPT